MPFDIRTPALCPTCGERDNIMHRVTECGEGRTVWEWTRRRIAWILPMDPVTIPNEWTIRPQFKLWPPRRHRAVLWILAHRVWYRVRGIRPPSEREYFDFLRRAHWKANQDAQLVSKVGNYLSCL